MRRFRYVLVRHQSLGPWPILFTDADISCEFQGSLEDRDRMDLGAAFCTGRMAHSEALGSNVRRWSSSQRWIHTELQMMEKISSW